MADEFSYTVHKMEMPDSGIGREMGYEDDNAFREAMKVKRAAMDPEVREALEALDRDFQRRLIFGDARN